MKIAVVLAVIASSVGGAWADEIRHPSGFSFDLPKLGAAWEQEVKGDIIIASTESDSLPELQVFAFPALKEGALTEIEGRLLSELARPGLSLDGEAIKSVKVGKAATETIGDASVRSGTATLNGEKATFAIVQRKGKSLILLGVPKPGIFERGQTNFAVIIKGLQRTRSNTAERGGGTPAPAPTPPAASSATLPKLATLAAVRDVTATSTFADKKNAYSAWRTLDYSQVLDASTEQYVPASAWCEGKPDEGIGEAFTISLHAPVKVDTIKIAAGVWKTAKLFAANNQITALDVTIDGKTTTVKPTDARTWVDVPVGRTVSTIVVKIVSVKKGKMNDSCVSGVELVTDKEPVLVLRSLTGPAADEFPRTLAKLQTALGSPGRAGLEQLLDFPFSLRDASGFVNGRTKAIKYASWKALDAACRAADKRATDDDSKPVTCPPPADVDSSDDRPATIVAPKAGLLEVHFPSHREVQEVWRLRWRDGAWRLTAIDYE